MPVHSNILSQCSNASLFVAISDALVVIVCVIMPNTKFVYHQLFSSNMMCHLCAEYELSRSDCIFPIYFSRTIEAKLHIVIFKYINYGLHIV